MKKILFLASMLIFLSSSIVNAATIDLYAISSSWTDTGIDINYGDNLNIVATGLASNRVSLWTPDGSSAIGDSGFVAPGLNKFSLVGRIEDNTPFLIGSSFNENIDQTGNLRLIFNDDVYHDNSGYWTVDINVSSVPLPGAAWLLGSGLAGLAGIRARRKKK